MSRTTRRAMCLAWLTTLVLAAACGDDDPTGTTAPTTTVTVCQFVRGGAAAVTIDAASLDSAIATGAYPTDLRVDPMHPVNDGVQFKTITAAMTNVRASRAVHDERDIAACRVTITVSEGVLNATTSQTTDDAIEHLPIVIDVPDVTIRGATIVPVDGNGRATGAIPSRATRIVPAAPLRLIGGASSQSGVSEEIFVVSGHPANGSKGHGAVIEGLVLQSGHAPSDTTQGGQGILSLRVRDLTVRGNRFEGNFTERIDLRATSALIDGNDIASGPGNTCDVCLAGPGGFVVRNNRIAGGGIPGILMVPTLVLPIPDVLQPYVPPAAAQVSAHIENNEILGHLRKPVGAGVRLATMGIGAPGVVGDSRATIVNNLIRNNTFGVIVEAGFPVNSGSLRGDATVTVTGNTLSGSCQNDLLVSFSRHTTALGLSSQPYLRNSTFALTLGPEVDWPAAWFSLPTSLGNTLIVNGAPVAPGVRSAYDGAKVCQ